MNRNKILAGAVSLALLGMSFNAAADATEDLVNALVTKGVLTEDEGSLLSKGNTSQKKNEGKVRFKDGFKLESADGNSSLAINGRVQLDYRTFDTDSGSSANSGNADTFDIRRAYLGAGGTFNKYYDWKLVANFAEAKNSLFLDEAFVNIKWFKNANIQAGQFKMPISLEERTSSRFTNFTERSFNNNGALVAGKDQGLMLHGPITKGLNYALALSSGNGQNTDDVNDVGDSDSLEYIGHVDMNLIDLTGSKADAVVHLGGSYAYSDLNVTQSGNAAISQKTLGRGSTFFTSAATNSLAVTDTMDRTRYNLEAALTNGPFKFQSEYSKAEIDITDTSSSTSSSQDINAFYADISWLVTGESYKDSYKKGKFDRIKPKQNFNPDEFTGGAWELALGYAKFDASDITSSSNGLKLSSGFTNEADTVRAGIKFIADPNTRIMFNVVKTNYEDDVTLGTSSIESGELAANMRVQYDF